MKPSMINPIAHPSFDAVWTGQKVSEYMGGNRITLTDSEGVQQAFRRSRFAFAPVRWQVFNETTSEYVPVEDAELLKALDMLELKYDQPEPRKLEVVKVSRKEAVTIMDEAKVFPDRFMAHKDNSFTAERGFFYRHGRTLGQFQNEIIAAFESKGMMVEVTEAFEDYTVRAMRSNTTKWVVKFRIVR